jgi:hypothetical protein
MKVIMAAHIRTWQMVLRLRIFVISAALAASLSAQALAQPGQPSGGTISGPAPVSKVPPKAAPKTGAKTPVKAPAKIGPRASSNNTSGQTASQAETIEGKWWTTGNGFGDSEVVFTQSGPHVSGVIRYADGRTGTVVGNMVGKKFQHTWRNSSGEGGTGWLELSWNNFLGGPWTNQKIKNGSWTLSRIEGKWCFGGSRNRIRTVTHNARGEVRMVTEDGSRDGGRLEGPLFFLDSDFGSIQGTMNFRKNRVDWSTGFFWTWCGR